MSQMIHIHTKQANNLYKKTLFIDSNLFVLKLIRSNDYWKSSVFY